MRLYILKFPRPLSGPALNDHLLFGVKLDGVTALSVHITEEAVLPAREREESHRSGHTNVDTNVARLGFVAKLACCGTAAREQARHVAIRSGVHQLNGLINRLSVHQAQHRAEDLDSSKLTTWVDIVQDCWAHEVATLVVGDRSIASINEDLRPLVHAFLDHRLNALLALSRDDRPHLDLRRKPVADLAPGRHIGNVLPESPASLTHCDRHCFRQAAL